MGNHSDRLNPKKNGKVPYKIETAEQFQAELYTLMDRLAGDVSLYSVSATLVRAQHVVQLNIDDILARSQEGDEDPEGKAEGGETKRTGPEYPH